MWFLTCVTVQLACADILKSATEPLAAFMTSSIESLIFQHLETKVNWTDVEIPRVVYKRKTPLLVKTSELWYL